MMLAIPVIVMVMLNQCKKFILSEFRTSLQVEQRAHLGTMYVHMICRLNILYGDQYSRLL